MAQKKSQTQAFDAKVRAITSKLLKPIARFALSRGLKLQELIDSLKSACLEVATEDLKKRGTEVNTSRLSVVTGLQRKEIRKLLSTDTPPVGSLNLLNRIIGQWRSDPRFTSEAGQPRPLECEGAESEFVDLVHAVSVDVNPYTVLFGLEQAGAVQRVGKEARLIHRVYDTSKDILNGLELLAQDSDRLHEAVSENLFTQPAIPNLHVTTRYDNICVEHLDEIRNWLLDKGSAFHEEVRTYLEKHDKDSNPRLYKKSGGATVSVSAFSFVETQEVKNENEK